MYTKKIWICLLMSFIGLVSCHQNVSGPQVETKVDDSVDQTPEVQVPEKKDEILSCGEICYEKIPDICAEKIGEIILDGGDVDKTIYGDQFCGTLCETWTDKTRECFSSIESCENVKNTPPYCDGVVVEVVDPPEKEKLDSACHRACKKYATCAGFADDATPADTKSAYTSCYSECGAWSEATVNCINSKAIRWPADCMHLSRCALKEYVQ